MSKDKSTKGNPYQVVVNDRNFINAEGLESAVSMALGLHKMSNLDHRIEVVNPLGEHIVYFDTKLS